jgi:hypothetical protein
VDERLEKLQTDLTVHSSFAENIDDPSQIDSVIIKLERGKFFEVEKKQKYRMNEKERALHSIFHVVTSTY